MAALAIRPGIPSLRRPGLAARPATLDSAASLSTTNTSSRNRARLRNRVVLVAAFQQEEAAVTFQVEKQAGPGEHLRVVGEPPALGGWIVSQAPALQQAGSLWSGTVEGFRVGSAFHFKFAVVPNKAPGADPKAVNWESIPDRTFQPGGSQTITAVFNKAGFETGPAAPSRRQSAAGAGQARGDVHGSGTDAGVKARLEETLHRLAKEALKQRNTESPKAQPTAQGKAQPRASQASKPGQARQAGQGGSRRPAA